MPNGTVKFFNPGKGFGFITPDEGSKDVFVPAASIVAAGVSILKTGQRVSFEQAPDGKGPKAVNLKLLETPVMPEAVKSPPPPAKSGDSTQVTLYCDPSFRESEDILAALRAAGHTPLVVDYIATAPTRDKLKELSSLLRGTDQSLVRQYDPLFRDLRLDDRFISENEFWDGVVEHPSLINGPVVAFATRAAVCRSREALKAFLAPPSSHEVPASANRKRLSPRLLKLIMGDLGVDDLATDDSVSEDIASENLAAPPVTPKKDAVATEIAPAAKPAESLLQKTKPKPKAKVVVVAKTKPKPKTAVKVEKPKKKTVKSPAKKARRS